MKLLKHISTLILIFSLLLAVLAGGAALLPDGTTEDVPQNSDTQSDYSAVTDNPKLKYTLTQQDLTDFEAKIAETKARMLAAQTCDEAEAEMDLLMEEYEKFRQQKTVAEILYHCFPLDEKTTEDYLFASQAVSKGYLAMVDLEKELYYENPPYRDEYFEGMTEEELEEAIKASQEMSRHSTLQSEIITDFYGDETYEDRTQIYKLYVSFLESANSLAQAAGMKNFYEYASAFTYFRDYGKEEREKFRTYVQTYIVPLYNEAKQAFYDAAAKIPQLKLMALSNLVETAPYDSMETNYLSEYLKSLTGSMGEGMSHMFENNNYVFVTWEDANQRAFTAKLTEPFCYFGPGYYQSTFTVAHELGHYYAELHSKTENYSFDLGETHSLGNEFFLLNYMKNTLEEDVYEVLVLYKIYATTHSILIATVLDHFEETVYNNPELLQATSNEAFENILNDQVLPNYRLPADLKTSLSMMWKEICVTSPVYYLSYATSAVTSLNLYSMCLQDENAAKEAYRKAVEEQTGFFLETINLAGIPSPFEESAYLSLKNLITKN